MRIPPLEALEQEKAQTRSIHGRFQHSAPRRRHSGYARVRSTSFFFLSRRRLIVWPEIVNRLLGEVRELQALVGADASSTTSDASRDDVEPVDPAGESVELTDGSAVPTDKSVDLDDDDESIDAELVNVPPASYGKVETTPSYRQDYVDAISRAMVIIACTQFEAPTKPTEVKSPPRCGWHLSNIYGFDSDFRSMCADVAKPMFIEAKTLLSKIPNALMASVVVSLSQLRAVTNSPPWFMCSGTQQTHREFESLIMALVSRAAFVLLPAMHLAAVDPGWGPHQADAIRLAKQATQMVMVIFTGAKDLCGLVSNPIDSSENARIAAQLATIVTDAESAVDIFLTTPVRKVSPY